MDAVASDREQTVDKMQRDRRIMIGLAGVLLVVSGGLAVVAMIPFGPTLEGDVAAIFAGFWWIQIVTVGILYKMAHRVYPAPGSDVGSE